VIPDTPLIVLTSVSELLLELLYDTATEAAAAASEVVGAAAAELVVVGAT
jgi:hypothetical protein